MPDKKELITNRSQLLHKILTVFLARHLNITPSMDRFNEPAVSSGRILSVIHKYFLVLLLSIIVHLMKRSWEVNMFTCFFLYLNVIVIIIKKLDLKRPA